MKRLYWMLTALSILNGCSESAFAGTAMVHVVPKLPVQPWPSKIFIPAYQVTVMPVPAAAGSYAATIWRSSIFPTRTSWDSRQGYVTITGIDGTPTNTFTVSPTPTLTSTKTYTPTTTWSNTPGSGTNTWTPTPTYTRTPTAVVTRTPTPTSTYYPLRGVYVSWNATRSKLQTLNAARWSFSLICQAPIPSQTPTLTPTVTPTNTPTNSPTNSPTKTPTLTATNTPTLTVTNTPGSLTNTPTITSTPTNTPTGSPTLTPTITPTPFF